LSVPFRKNVRVLIGSFTFLKKIFKVKELEALYSGEWVLLVNPKHIERLEMLRGELGSTARTEMKSIRKRTGERTPHTAIFYVGKLPEDLVVML
jgi:hypothetical protein